MIRQPDRTSVFKRGWVACGLLALIAFIGVLAAIAVERYPTYFSERRARELLVELGASLLTYAIAIVLAARIRGVNTDPIYGIAFRFGLVTGVFEIVGIAIENGIPFAIRGPAMQIGFMVLIFGLWGVAGFRGVQLGGSFRAGLGSAVSAAMICMVAGVAGGFLLELFLFPPNVASISTWPEFLRSGSTDPRAFGIANTIDSGFTHLRAAPIAGAVFGSVGAALAWAFAPIRNRDAVQENEGARK